MEYKKIKMGRFKERLNRFLATAEIDGKLEYIHVRNTGRLKELLLPGVEICMEDCGNREDRKTRYSLVSVKKGHTFVNIDSQIPNALVFEGLLSEKIKLPGMGSPLEIIQKEKKLGRSRIDIYAEDEAGQRAFAEVKGVTLEKNGIAMFPDAPTERGKKHVLELAEAVAKGYLAYIIFIIQMKGTEKFMPNDDMHTSFGESLRAADKRGVKIMAYDCRISAGTIDLSEPVKVVL